MRNEFAVICAGVLGATLLSGSLANAAEAQAPAANDAPAQSPPAADQKATPHEPLSKKLDENEGVLEPPRGVDPKIHKEPPHDTGDKMPIIVPPGEPGGDQSIQPK